MSFDFISDIELEDFIKLRITLSNVDLYNVIIALQRKSIHCCVLVESNSIIVLTLTGKSELIFLN